MRRVLKYEVHLQPFDVALPEKGKITHVGLQHGKFFMWVEDTTESKTVVRRFEVFGTGMVVRDDTATHIFTWQDGEFVWHLYEIETVTE